MNPTTNNIKVFALAVVFLALAIVTDSPSAGFALGATFMMVANYVRRKPQ